MSAGDPGLTPERWRVVKQTLHAALALNRTERSDYVERACAGDGALRREVDALLAIIDELPGAASDVLERPAAGSLATGSEQIDVGAMTSGTPTRDAPLWEALAGRYTLECEIGRGGMATVYRVRDLHVGRAVALKVLRADVGAVLGASRFRSEIRFVAGLHHPHILAMYDWGEAAGRLWFTMPYVDGETLRQRLHRAGALTTGDAVRIARAVASALEYMHGFGIVHRDVKPENVLLLHNGHALVADFGIAKAVDAARDADAGVADVRTGTGFVLGTPAYMSPEQAVGDSAIDPRTDVYALGLLLYEMLAGVPALRGRDLGALAMSRFAGPARPLPDIRPDVPAILDQAVARALQPAAADRYPTAAAFDAALSRVTSTTAEIPDKVFDRDALSGALDPQPGPVLRARWRGVVAGVGVAATIGAVALAGLRAGGEVTLDPTRVVVVPIDTSAGTTPARIDENLSSLIGAALDATAPFHWVDGTDSADVAPAARARVPGADQRRRFSIAQHAGYYIDGTVTRRGNSTTVALRLHSVAGDSVVARRSASGRAGETATTDLALRAVSGLLTPLLMPGREVDVSELQRHVPSALAEFLRGEREYRASHFVSALAHYRAALDRDSAFALAAVQGTQTASWVGSMSDSAAALLVRAAVIHVGSLRPYHAAIARGYAAHLAGAADSAVAEFRRALAIDSTRPEPWMGLGEVYRHLLPRATNLDSLAEDAYGRARRADPRFTPPLYHLVEMAIRRGALGRADTLLRAFWQADRDNDAFRALDLAVRCARDTTTVAWVAAADPDAALPAAFVLDGPPIHAACARTAFTAAFNAPNVAPGRRWVAMLGVQGLLAATGRDSVAGALLRSQTARSVGADRLLILDAIAGIAVDSAAAEVVRAIGTDYRSFTAPRLWLLGAWQGERGRGADVRVIARLLAVRVASSHSRADSLLMRTMEARVALADGDTAEAVRRLRALTPSAPSEVLEHDPWECLGAERLLLARLLLARGEYREAGAVAELLDAPHPITMLLYRRAGLLLRLRAAAARGVDDAEARARLRELARPT